MVHGSWLMLLCQRGALPWTEAVGSGPSLDHEPRTVEQEISINLLIILGTKPNRVRVGLFPRWRGSPVPNTTTTEKIPNLHVTVFVFTFVP